MDSTALVNGIPGPDEAADYYFKYIERVPGDDIVSVLQAQLDQALTVLADVPNARSAEPYAPDKWSYRQLVSHLSDVERVFGFRAFWFARGFDSPLPSFEPEACQDAAQADRFSWAELTNAFRASRLASIGLFRTLPADAWMRRGVASGNSFSVRALAYILAGHVAHHLALLPRSVE